MGLLICWAHLEFFANILYIISRPFWEKRWLSRCTISEYFDSEDQGKKNENLFQKNRITIISLGYKKYPESYGEEKWGQTILIPFYAGINWLGCLASLSA